MTQPLWSLPAEIKNAPFVVPTRTVTRVEDVKFVLSIWNCESAIYLKADFQQTARDVRLVPTTDIGPTRLNLAIFPHMALPGLQRPDCGRLGKPAGVCATLKMLSRDRSHPRSADSDRPNRTGFCHKTYVPLFRRAMSPMKRRASVSICDFAQHARAIKTGCQ